MSPKRQVTQLRDELLDLQLELRESKRRALALIVTGAPSAGRSETINGLLEWLDPKYIRVHAFGPPDVAERRRPAMWRYWRTLPARGSMTFYFAGWYADSLSSARTGTRVSPQIAKRAVERIRQLESMLAADGISVVKVHLQVDRSTQRERLKRLCANELTRWRVTDEDRWFARHYTQAKRIARGYIKATTHPAAPWHVIDGKNEVKRLLEVGGILRNALKRTLAKSSAPKKTARPNTSLRRAQLRADVAAKELDDDQYEEELEALQGRLALLVRRPRFRRHALALVFEGIDAAGKGGAIRRVTHALDARQYQVVPVSAPSAEEARYPYLWRFWRHVPERGEIAIFDRSWYGRVLVERVRHLTPQADWQRAYGEINEFERQLTEHGVVVAKFWLSISKQEQLERFKAREENPLKRFKRDKEDWTNRRYFDAYEAAAAEMIRRTASPDAPWTVVDADIKKHARLQVLREVCDELQNRLG